MLDNSEVRAHLRMGEQAVTLLKSMGYHYEQPSNAVHQWVAPEKPVDALKDALEALIKTGIEEGVKKALKVETAAEPDRGPRWGIVKGLVGGVFKIRPENIPVFHKLSGYSHGPHFFGKAFSAIDIQYRTDVQGYTGYAVIFEFNTRAYQPEVVWLPLSACLFRQ